jgi:DNA polymerase
MEKGMTPAGTRVPAGTGFSTILPDMDFETYSDAGLVLRLDGKWQSIIGPGKKGGLSAVGMAVYSEHPSTEVLCLAYDLKDGKGKRLWKPGEHAPVDLFDHIAQGGLIEAHNAAFEFYIWENVCRKRMGWPPLPFRQLRDSAAKARAWSYPGALDKIAKLMGTEDQKIADGKRLIKKFCVPRNQTKKDKRLRIQPGEDPEDAIKFYEYCIGDIAAESAISERLPDLPPDEEEFYINTLACNTRGVAVRKDELEACIAVLDQAYAKYNTELYKITGGTVAEASKVSQLQEWCNTQGVRMPSMDDAAITAALAQPIPPHVKRALWIRQMIGSAGVKKVYAMKYRATSDSRLKDLFIYHGARTGRDTGADVQPQNLVKAGPKVKGCPTCSLPSGAHNDWCPHCGGCLLEEDAVGWSWEAMDTAINVIGSRDLAYVESVFGDAVLTVSGCVRGLFVAGPGKELICSDYSAIEAVVTAALAGEQWRLDAFNAKRDIYLMSASAITGTPYEEYEAYHKETGQKHPDRQKIGKVAELALGYGGWISAWRNFDKSDNFTDEKVKELILKWRDASPSIVEMWGGQVRGKPWRPEKYELYGFEGAAISAVLNPGQCYGYGLITYGVKDDVLYCRLPSGRSIAYHKPRLTRSTRWEGVDGLWDLSFEGWNSNPVNGPVGWLRMQTYGSKLTENIVQAVSRDIMAYANNNLEPAGYPVVLRVHDEIVSEVDEGFGSVEEFERIMGTLPEWAKGWPVRASGGWRGTRYRKD